MILSAWRDRNREYVVALISKTCFHTLRTFDKFGFDSQENALTAGHTKRAVKTSENFERLVAANGTFQRSRANGAISKRVFDDAQECQRAGNTLRGLERRCLLCIEVKSNGPLKFRGPKNFQFDV